MRVLIDIGHPAHVHLFKNLAWKLQERGHTVLFTCRDREHVLRLLQIYGFVFENFGRHYKKLSGKLWGLVKNELQMLNTALIFKPDLFISHGSTIAAHTSFLINKPHIALEDTFNMEQVRLCMPFTEIVLTGDYDHISLGKKEIRYPGYHELAYLHPNVFTPDERVLDRLGVGKGERYCIVRFVAWAATHDVGMKGMKFENKLRLIKELSQHMKVFISSEAVLPNELKEYQIRILPENMHSALAFATLFVGESSTMATEAAVLGVPAVFIHDTLLGLTTDMAKKGLLLQFSSSDSDQMLAIENAIELANEKDSSNYQNIREKMLKDKIDVSAFMLWFVVNYPKSAEALRKQKLTWDQFR